MAAIHIMDEQLANLIAAGEVVERPSSVVKELVENSIDAGSTRIEIHLEEGGLASIRIKDNGIGMDRDDCRLAFERHATSKLKRARDLSHIRTLGFRGEAIPSIAAVSRMEVISTAEGAPAGTRIFRVADREEACEPAAFPRGTEIKVYDLFFNTPARLKYMKSIQTEIGHVSDVINRLALSHPEIAFLLTHNDKQILKTSGDGQVLHVISAIYGLNLAKNMVAIQAESLDYTLSGFIAKPEFTRANRSYISTIINGRYIRNIGLANAVLRGYHTLLPINRFPVVVLAVDMDPTLVDVNVHPAKLEVRFSKEQELYSFVEQEVRSVWGRQRLIPEPGRDVRRGQPEWKNQKQEAIDWSLLVPSKSSPSLEISMTSEAPTKIGAQPNEQSTFNTQKSPQAKQQQVASGYVKRLEDTWQTQVARETQETLETQETREIEETQETEESRETQETNVYEVDEREQLVQEFPQVQASTENEVQPGEVLRVPEMYPMAQLHGTYILAQNQDGMYMIDQHAAQERIFYEFFLGKLHDDTIESQDLLLPITLDLTKAEALAVEENTDKFSRVGVYLEPFGSNSYMIRSHPRWLPKGEEESILREMVDMVVKQKKEIDVVKLREAAAITMSCKAAIKANRYLTHAEMEALIQRLRRTTSPFTCPHGRPIIVHFSTYDIEKMFKRVM
ncbi:DNA mismatch repair endonuclease MutL [Aneurinibacillus sp. Ricciae_BoGa-3]|uniref:DNA mismatch repair endonuclease MutL n=1 Tax=Aneurinibacillus sp. Ricciae_BoGa-3 TaxID=3022697 RepID=UPI00234159D7|nr:DNA mismatch repair endonuclease MutL [Aneurinibacillus sp. Ricciae_BoGa-3]WCK56163.1 DNA mismatch repair endonuclease MutL [Aneurinibacillus sp. Ricciae_BoGa-3]